MGRRRKHSRTKVILEKKVFLHYLIRLELQLYTVVFRFQVGKSSSFGRVNLAKIENLTLKVEDLLYSNSNFLVFEKLLMHFMTQSQIALSMVQNEI